MVCCFVLLKSMMGCGQPGHHMVTVTNLVVVGFKADREHAPTQPQPTMEEIAQGLLRKQWPATPMDAQVG